MSRVPRSSPQWYAEELGQFARVPAGDDERFVGYAIVGQRFQSGHVLALRRWPVSSIGPAYTSVWHQLPDGSWNLYADVSPAHSCARYVDSGMSESWQGPIQLCWASPYRLRVDAREVGLEWEIDFRRTWMTRAFSALCQVAPAALLTSMPALSAFDRMAGAWLRTGPIGLSGVMPNGNSYRVLPRQLWLMEDARAWLYGVPLGRAQHGAPSARIGAYRVATSGALTMATAHFAPHR